MNRPDIVFLTSSYPRYEGDWAGVFVHELAELYSKETEVWVVAPKSSNTADSSIPFAVHRFWYPGWRDDLLFYGLGAAENLKNPLAAVSVLPAFASMLAHTYSTIRRRCGNDLPILVSHWLVPAGLVGAALKRMGTVSRHVVVSHGSDAAMLESFPMGRALLRLIASGTDSFISTNSRIASFIEQSTGADVSVLPMGVHVSPRPKKSPHARAGSLKVLFAGRLTAAKGVFDLAEIASKLGRIDDKIRIFAAGHSADETIEQRLSSSGVELLGELDHSSLMQLYSEFDVLLFLSSRGEGAPRVVIEALSKGMVIVGYSIPSVEELCAGSGAILVDAGDTDAIVERLVWLANNSETLAEFAALAYKRGMELDWMSLKVEYDKLIYGMKDERPTP